MPGWMICTSCGGSLRGIKRPDGLIYRCSICGHETKDLPLKKPVIRKEGWKGDK